MRGSDIEINCCNTKYSITFGTLLSNRLKICSHYVAYNSLIFSNYET
jgi:hypothetical protein